MTTDGNERPTMQGPAEIDPKQDAAPTGSHRDALADDLTPGTTLLDGQYTILGFLTSGAFGITYLAKESLGRTVVIKECFPNALCRRSSTAVRARSRKYAGDFSRFVQSFMEEARRQSRLVHPNIVGVHQVFEENGTAYIAIDYISGKDLHDILDSTDRAFSPGEIVALLKKLLGAVEFIHEAGILHRDISPDNILIDQTGNPILIDFGAAGERMVKATRVQTWRRVVKAGYSPHEFYLTGADQGPSSDLYALGATFYRVISGTVAPESQRRLSRIAEGLPDPYEPLAGRFEGYPPGFLAAIDQATRVMPRDRIQGATDWLEMIEHGENNTLQGQWRRTGTSVRGPGTGTFLAANKGYFVGAGLVLVFVAIATLWTVLT